MKRIAWFSPLPISKGSQESVGAYWTEKLLPHLKNRFEIEVFYDGFNQYGDFKTAHFLAAAKRHAENPFDFFLYQFEDKPCANFVRMHLGLIPGLVIFHDLLLTTDGPEPILNSSWEETVKQFGVQNISWPNRKNEYKRERPLAVREIGLAPVALFSCPRMHSEYCSAIVSRPHLGQGMSYFIPHPVAVCNENTYGTKGGQRVAMCGSPWIEFRAHKILQALSGIKEAELVWLVSEREETPAKELLKEFPRVRATIVTGRSPEKWREIVSGADVAAHLHFSVYGQMGPYLNISQMVGLPSVILGFGGAEYLSGEAVVKIEPGESEATQLSAALQKIFSDRGTDWGRYGRELALEDYNTEKVASELVAVLDKESDSMRELLTRWSRFESEARAATIHDSTPARDPIVATLDEREAAIFSELGWGR